MWKKISSADLFLRYIANLDPKHRDRIAFLRFCSGKFERNKYFHHVRLDKMYVSATLTSFMARDKSIIEDAYPGDVVGLFDTGNFKIGDTLTEGEDFYFTGHSLLSHLKFLKKWWTRTRWKQKQLEKRVAAIDRWRTGHNCSRPVCATPSSVIAATLFQLFLFSIVVLVTTFFKNFRWERRNAGEIKFFTFRQCIADSLKLPVSTNPLRHRVSIFNNTFITGHKTVRVAETYIFIQLTWWYLFRSNFPGANPEKGDTVRCLGQRLACILKNKSAETWSSSTFTSLAVVSLLRGVGAIRINVSQHSFTPKIINGCQKIPGEPCRLR